MSEDSSHSNAIWPCRCRFLPGSNSTITTKCSQIRKIFSPRLPKTFRRIVSRMWHMMLHSHGTPHVHTPKTASGGVTILSSRTSSLASEMKDQTDSESSTEHSSHLGTLSVAGCTHLRVFSPWLALSTIYYIPSSEVLRATWVQPLLLLHFSFTPRLG